MYLHHIITILLGLVFTVQGFCLQVSPQTASEIGTKIWKNECGGKIEGLTHWNEGENFGSFGIGHFIWYPEKGNERFQDTFPQLLTFLKDQGVIIPKWLLEANGCPWPNRESFYRDIDSTRMKSLRQFLLDTKDKQAAFMAFRLENALPDIVSNLSPQQEKNVRKAFARLSKDPKGLYALIDYANFKGLGTTPSESYQGQGWGLKQVLCGIPASSQNTLGDFVAIGKKLLTTRVENSPPERNEKRWLKGWLNRLDTYQ